jgi:hypothetical protein
MNQDAIEGIAHGRTPDFGIVGDGCRLIQGGTLVHVGMADTYPTGKDTHVVSQFTPFHELLRKAIIYGKIGLVTKTGRHSDTVSSQVLVVVSGSA